MCKKEDELVAIIDEMVGAAVSMNQGAQSYDYFIQARDKGMLRIKETFAHNSRLASGIEALHKLI
jgi:hypothetical protein